MVDLTNVGSTYDAIPASRGLGIRRMDFSGVTQLEFTVQYNKIGTGTLSFQLWNVTDGAEVARIDDAAVAADNKIQSVTVPISGMSGIKTLRVRAKSTVAGDDPKFYGADVMETRA